MLELLEFGLKHEGLVGVLKELDFNRIQDIVRQEISEQIDKMVEYLDLEDDELVEVPDNNYADPFKHADIMRTYKLPIK